MGMRTAGAAVTALALVLGAGAAEAASARWRDMPGAKPQLTGALNNVEFVSKKLGWAAGSEGGALALWKWNGKAWTRVKNAWKGAPVGLAASGTKNAWLTGITLGGSYALHWNGKTWRQTAFPGPGIPVDLAAAPDGTAVSVAADPLRGTFAVHTWKNGKWARANVPLPGGTSLTSVAVRAKNDVWLGGTYNASASSYGSLLMHWNGKKWRRITLAKDRLPVMKIYADSAGRAWVLRGGDHTALGRWNGTKLAEKRMPGGGGALTLTGDGSGGVWLLPYSGPKATQTPYFHWSKGKFTKAWGPRRSGTPGMGDIDQVPGTSIVVTVGGLQGSGKKVPVAEVLR